ncbi:Vacuolar protease A [Phlyctochytrium planicorne]|nr:Vacuolar protease A [Phlyctochytrium planicorne]
MESLASTAPIPLKISGGLLSAASHDRLLYWQSLSRSETPGGLLQGSGGKLAAFKDALTEFYATLQVGTPPQTLKALVDTGSQTLWLPSKSIISSGYDGSASSSYQSKDNNVENLTYFDGTNVTGILVADSVSVGDKTASNYGFLLATSVSYTTASGDDRNSGILGMGVGIKGDISQPFTSKLFETGIIYNNQFSYYISVDNSDGEITFGGYDVSLQRDPEKTLIWIPVATASDYLDSVLSTKASPVSVFEAGRWAIPIKSISLFPKWDFSNSSAPNLSTLDNSKSINLNFSENRTAAILDTGSSVAVLPSTIVTALGAALGIESAIKNPESFTGLSPVDCQWKNTSTDFIVTFVVGEGGNNVLAMSAVEYIIESKPGSCIMAVLGVPDDQGLVVFGNTVLK